MAMALAVISVAVGVAGVGMMIPSLIPEKDEHEPVVRVSAGLSWNEADTLSGNNPGVALYDVMGRKIGGVNGNKDSIKDGGFIDIKVPFDEGVGNKPAEYVQINDGGDDALCIAYVILTNPDGTQKAWYGDVAKACGADWYHSVLKTNSQKGSPDSTADYAPSCIWIDRNQSKGLRFQGFGLHIWDFVGTEERAKQFSDSKDLMCDSAPRFRMYEKMNSGDQIPYYDPPLDLAPDTLVDEDPTAVLDKARWKIRKEGDHVTKALIDEGAPKMKVKRATHSPAGSANSKVVVISTNKQHSAKELCESATSWGHDFVSSTEKLFCDMEPKKLWPVCDATHTSACFDMKTSSMKPGKGLRGRDAKSGQVPPEKKYGKTLRWD